MLRKFCSAFWESSKEMLVFLLKLSVVFCVFCGPVLMLMLLAIWALQPSTEAMMIILAVMMISLEVACNDKSGRVSRINKYLTKKGRNPDSSIGYLANKPHSRQRTCAPAEPGLFLVISYVASQ